MKVEENVIKWKKMVVDVQNEVFYRDHKIYGNFDHKIYGDFDHKTL